MGLEGLLLHEALVAEVTLIGTDVGVDQHVSLHVGQQGELTATDPTFVLFHTLWGGKIQKSERGTCARLSRVLQAAPL